MRVRITRRNRRCPDSGPSGSAPAPEATGCLPRWGPSGGTGKAGATGTTYGHTGTKGQTGASGASGATGEGGNVYGSVSAWIGYPIIQVVSGHTGDCCGGAGGPGYLGYNPQNNSLVEIPVAAAGFDAGKYTQGSAFSAGPSGFAWNPLGIFSMALFVDQNSGGFLLAPWQAYESDYYKVSTAPLQVGDFVGGNGSGGAIFTDSAGNTLDGIGFTGEETSYSGSGFPPNVGFGSQGQVTGTSYYIGIVLYYAGSPYTGLYYGWLEFEAGDPYSCQSGSSCSKQITSTGNFPQMLLVDGAIAMVPDGAIQVGQYYSNPIGSPQPPYNGSANPVYPAGPCVTSGNDGRCTS